MSTMLRWLVSLPGQVGCCGAAFTSQKIKHTNNKFALYGLNEAKECFCVHECLTK